MMRRGGNAGTLKESCFECFPTMNVNASIMKAEGFDSASMKKNKTFLGGN